VTAMENVGNHSAEDIEARLRAVLAEVGTRVDDRLIGLLRTMVTRPAKPAPEGSIDLPLSDGTIPAAISHSFALAPLGLSLDVKISRVGSGDAPIIPDSASEQSALLAHSPVVVVGGQRRLMLTNRARASVINAAVGMSRFQEILAQESRQDVEKFDQISLDDVRLPSAWLRSFLTGTQGRLQNAPAREVRAAVEALECLQEVPYQGPTLVAARRLRDFAELLEPLRILIGQRGGWEGAPLKDRFVGREDELQQLRSFVDELASKSTYESVSRFVHRNVRRAASFVGLRDESVFFIEARGGLGKSTLIAKFTLDHALSQERPFPFAYLDFDRGALQARNPMALLAEVARQVSLQSSDWQEVLTDFRANLRDEMSSTSPNMKVDPFQDFRGIVRTQITRGSRPFVLVLDTMEVVQYDPLSIEGIVEFVGRLAGGEHEQVFEELKIVASGRADIPELRTSEGDRSERRHLRLAPLLHKDARLMVQKLGQWLMPDSWHETWGREIAGRMNDPPERREPLALRVAVELLRETPAEKRAELAHEIGRSGEAANEYFVGRLYERRILSHIRDEDVRRLAWPGLIFRRVTPALIQDPLAALCNVDPACAEQLFRALSSEVWMVEAAGANVVRHRPDLRARTLPMMRRHTVPGVPSFEQVNLAAIQYYEKLHRRTGDWAFYAEWIYHRLLAGEDCSRIDRDWQPELTEHLLGAADDLERDSEQRSYLMSRTATGLLAPTLLQQLPPPLAFDHIARTGQQLGSFNESRIQPIVVDLASRTSMSDDARYRHPAMGVLMIKSGRWSDRMTFDRGSGDAEWEAHAAFAARFKRARAEGLSGFLPESLLVGARRDLDPATIPVLMDWRGVKDAPLRAWIQDLAYARLVNHDAVQSVEEMVVQLLEEAPICSSPSDIAALRTAVVFGRDCSRAAAQLWLRSHREGAWRRSAPSLSAAELRALLGAHPKSNERAFATLSPLLRDVDISWLDFIGLLETSSRPIRVEHPSLANLLEETLERLIANRSDAALQSLRKFFAARDEDWIVPIGYALARMQASTGKKPSPVTERLAAYVSFAPRPGLFARRKSQLLQAPRDLLQVLRLADEASDLGPVVHLLAERSSDLRDAADLSILLARYVAWRQCINRILVGAPLQRVVNGSSSDAIEETAESFISEAVVSDYLDRRGYDPGFLGGDGYVVKFPTIVHHTEDVLQFPGLDDLTSELRYEHFSVVMSRSRRMCIFSAVNVDGAQSRKTSRVDWKWDPRIPRQLQIMGECYGDPPRFSRGHMTRREDPAWGDAASARRGNADSMHVTNATPQMQAFNSPIWLALEDYALRNAREDGMKISVFTGPYFSHEDPEQYGVRIPLAFWKVIAFIHDETGELCATGYEMDQTDTLVAHGDDEFVYGAFHSPHLGQVVQVPIKAIELRSGVSFGELSQVDPLDDDREAVILKRPVALSAMNEIRFVQ